MTPIATIADIVDLYAARGGRTYGEGVSQTEHSVQCATLAEAGGGTPALVIAALLHDIGHLVVDPDDLTVDDRHERVGADVLERLFPRAVSDPVALHVAAKRYLCFVEPRYPAGLSRASRASLVVQGGAFDRAEARAFERLPHWREAVAVRRFDDWGKRDEAAGRVFADYIPMMQRLARESTRGSTRSSLAEPARQGNQGRVGSNKA